MKCKSTGGRERRQDGWFERIRSLQNGSGSHPLELERQNESFLYCLDQTQPRLIHVHTHHHALIMDLPICARSTQCAKTFPALALSLPFSFCLLLIPSRCHSLPNKIDFAVVRAPPAPQSTCASITVWIIPPFLLFTSKRRCTSSLNKDPQCKRTQSQALPLFSPKWSLNHHFIF